MARGDGEDRFGEIGPGRLARPRHMEDAVKTRRRLRDEATRGARQRLGDVERAGRIAALVGDDPDLVAGLAEAQHGAHELAPKGL